MNTEEQFRNNLIEHYKINVDLYKHYFELLIKFNIFYYAITGAILSYYFSNNQIIYLRYSLLLPILISLIFGFFFFWASKLVMVSRQDIIEITSALGFKTYPEFKVLKNSLILFGILLFFVALCLIILFLISFCNTK
jgi:hypothetical protein